MILPDVNVLIYAHRGESLDHSRFRGWLDSVVNDDQAYGMSEFVLSSFLRIVTHPKVFREPTPLSEALTFVQRVGDQPHCVRVRPGSRHWAIFTRLCAETGARGNLVADAFLAALAIEHGCEWITADRDFARFQGLRWRHPLA